MTNQQIAKQLQKLAHPGQRAVIAGVSVKREAARYVISGDQYAYDLGDGIACIKRDSEGRQAGERG